MENSLPMVLPFSSKANRFKLNLEKQESPSAIDLSGPVSSIYRYGFNERSNSSTGKLSGHSNGAYHFQELCLDDNKWIIFDEDRERDENVERKKSMRPLTTMKKLRKNKKNNQPFKNLSSQPSSFFHECQRQRIHQQKSVLKISSKCQSELKQLTTVDSQRIPTNKVNFRKIKEGTIRTQHSKENQLGAAQGRRVENSPGKASCSGQSRRSCMAKGKDGQSFVKSPSKSNRKLPSSRSIKTQGAEDKSGLLDRIPSDTEISNNFQQISQLLDPIEALCPNYLGPPLTQNPYEDFPEWGRYETLPQLLKLNLNQGLSTNQNETGQNTPNYLRKGNLPEDFSEKCHMRVSNKPQKALRRFRESSTISKDNSRRNSPARLSLKQKSCSDEVTEKEKEREKQQDGEFEMKPQYVTTRQTDKPLNSYEQRKQDFQNEVVQQQNEPRSSTGSASQDRQSLDKDFVLQNQFGPEQSMNLIEIKKTKQTAYFPSNTRIPSYILNSSNPSKLYKNSEMISLLNLFLKVQPEAIKTIFLSPDELDQTLYSCLLYHENQVKTITVDAILPFDSNYYPLFGSVEQYIWFAVLIKSIAKMTGSYRAVAQLNFKEVFSMVTGFHLVDVSSQLESSSFSLQMLQAFLKQTKLHNSFVLVENEDNLYKIQELLYTKSATEQDEEQEHLVLSRMFKTKQKERSKKRFNMQSLNKFLKTKKEEIFNERTFKNTLVRMVGVAGSKRVPIKNLLTQKYTIWVPTSASRSEVSQQSS